MIDDYSAGATQAIDEWLAELDVSPRLIKTFIKSHVISSKIQINRRLLIWGCNQQVCM